MDNYGELNLNGVIFELDKNIRRENKFYIFESDEYEGMITVSMNVYFQKKEYENEIVSPSISINEHETNVSEVEKLIGQCFKVDTVEEADEREDTFYMFEHEPMEKYEFKILEISEMKVHIQIKGTAIVDGYTQPYKTADFSGDFWLPLSK